MSAYRSLRRVCLFMHALLAIGAAPAFAQTDTNAVGNAVDAFGERVGIEQIGLYSESQVRGFSLSTTGSYRIDGA